MTIWAKSPRGYKTLTIYALNEDLQNIWNKSDRNARKKDTNFLYVVKDFKIPLSINNRAHRQKNKSKDVEDLNNNVIQLNLIDVYRTFHTTAAEYTFFSSTAGTFTKIRAYSGP